MCTTVWHWFDSELYVHQLKSVGHSSSTMHLQSSVLAEEAHDEHRLAHARWVIQDKELPPLHR